MDQAVNKMYLTTRFTVTKEVAGEERRIKGIASTSSPDREGDIVQPMGAQFKLPFPLLAGHDHSKPVGQVTKATPTPNGLMIEAQLAPEGTADFIDETWGLIKSGLMTGLSIGFRPLTPPMETITGRVFESYEVYELSVCTVPMNQEAGITFAKSNNQGTNMNKQVSNNQVFKAISKEWNAEVVKAVRARLAVEKAAVPAANLNNSSAVYYPGQMPGVITPPVTPSIIAALAAAGAAQLPPNTRVATSAAIIEASEIPDGAMYPAAAPNLEANLLTSARKFGVILGFTNEMVGVSNYSTAVQDYVESQLNTAASTSTDRFFVGLVMAQGVQASVQGAAGTVGLNAAIAYEVAKSYECDPRTSVWLSNPSTLMMLQSADNPNLGANGGVYKGIQAFASMAVPADTLLLVDIARTAVFDGPQMIEKAESASVIFDTDPGTASTAPRSLFQDSLVALKITKFSDAALMAKPLVLNLS